MTTILPKEPVVTERKNVILSDAERRNLRRKLRGSVEVTKDVLNPKKQLKRLVARNTAKAKDVAKETATVARKGAPVFGLLGVSTLLFVARKPISRWLSGIGKNKKQPTPPQDTGQ